MKLAKQKEAIGDGVISRHYRRHDFPEKLLESHKIEIFRDRMHGWYLDIAEQVLGIPHAGFGALMILCAYFETIAKYKFAKSGVTGSRNLFKRGLTDVYSSANWIRVSEKLDVIYETFRCGMYHAGFPEANVVIDGSFKKAIAFKGKMLQVNPTRLLEDIKSHLSKYIADLHSSSDPTTNDNFIWQFDLATTINGKRSKPRPVK